MLRLFSKIDFDEDDDMQFLTNLRVLNNRRIERRRLKKPFRITPQGFHFRGLDVQFTDEWERHTKCLISALAKNHHLLINVGAHYGFYTCLAASLQMDVIAIEPIDQNFKMLRDNVKKNGFDERCLLLHCAAGDRKGVEKIFGAFSGATMLQELSNKPKTMFQETQVLKLDDLLIPDTNKVILMDVEFFEYNVLCGALKLLDEPEKTKWIIEMIYSSDRQSNYNKTLGLMKKNEYQAIVEVENGFALMDLNDNFDQYEIHPISGNVLFVHESDTQSIKSVCDLVV